MDHIIQHLMQRPISPIAASGISVSGAVVAEQPITPNMQLLAWAISVTVGLMGFAIAAYQIREIWRKEKSGWKQVAGNAGSSIRQLFKRERED